MIVCPRCHCKYSPNPQCPFCDEPRPAAVDCDTCGATHPARESCDVIFLVARAHELQDLKRSTDAAHERLGRALDCVCRGMPIEDIAIVVSDRLEATERNLAGCAEQRDTARSEAATRTQERDTARRDLGFLRGQVADAHGFLRAVWDDGGFLPIDLRVKAVLAVLQKQSTDAEAHTVLAELVPDGRSQSMLKLCIDVRRQLAEGAEDLREVRGKLEAADNEWAERTEECDGANARIGTLERELETADTHLRFCRNKIATLESTPLGARDAEIYAARQSLGAVLPCSATAPLASLCTDILQTLAERTAEVARAREWAKLMGSGGEHEKARRMLTALVPPSADERTLLEQCEAVRDLLNTRTGERNTAVLRCDTLREQMQIVIDDRDALAEDY